MHLDRVTLVLVTTLLIVFMPNFLQVACLSMGKDALRISRKQLRCIKEVQNRDMLAGRITLVLIVTKV